MDSGEVIDQKANGIPIVASLEDAINLSKTLPQYFIFGLAPTSGFLSGFEKKIITPEAWRCFRTALDFASYLQLNKFMQWVSGNIGYHSIHHLNV